MSEIRFASKEHERFFFSMLAKCGNSDSCHRAFFYCVGISDTTRGNVEWLFDFQNDRINPDGLHEGWQTGGTMRLTRLAFNLWNGYVEETEERLSTPNEIFDCGYAPYFYEAVRQRYPEDCDPFGNGDNLIVYGHHIKGGRMFGALTDYTKKEFYESHKTIRFDTLEEIAEYEIIAAFKTTVYDDAGFPYYLFTSAHKEEEFTAYMETCRELSLYDTGETAVYGDRLLTLSTCEYSAPNGRFVVVAKKVTE
ncbi:DUF6075 family protein [Candidatus Merdisoma sp. JLR.KK011]|uniref:DUF6075 family protein n=1 Tax=Candidatus Merdisoma sp. JLR.KK011 TaxID=3114299 RepID=UPI002FF09BC2